MRLDLLGRHRQLVRDALEDADVFLGRQVAQGDVRVRERRLLDVVVDRAAPLLVGRFQLDLDARAVILVPLDLGAFFCVSIAISKRCAGFLGPIFEIARTGLPVVSMPYMPAAEIPIPCCPRCCFSRWNFEP
jgi:hypothetical protein